MATFLRPLSYQYPWLYNTISRLSSLAVGGEKRFRSLSIEGINIDCNTKILDLCCGSGQTTEFLVKKSSQVTGLDASSIAIERAKQVVPEATYVNALAEKMPFTDQEFDLVHTSVALHEMETEQLREILREVYRVLKPEGIFTLIDLHKPTNILFWPSLATFMWLFETKTAWKLLETNLIDELKDVGFNKCKKRLYAGGSLQVIQVRK
ncbi:class I SAM-dependent methyltransferase [Crocosphaera chwakensis]|uniref:UbiE/COQ5 methyltransferase n=1 Tax=Crocosphaera chwakensis CCY0110 TaxID=391612 RepID=A3ISI4_9CHRO|nr:class I SAM-dependent methyltransferase [Crocosphaera chwakensis]EAZ90554.1 UbiE/COQ5 methyltransferase [Crocosphaera chwakensis CCY0110]